MDLIDLLSFVPNSLRLLLFPSLLLILDELLGVLDILGELLDRLGYLLVERVQEEGEENEEEDDGEPETDQLEGGEVVFDEAPHVASDGQLQGVSLTADHEHRVLVAVVIVVRDLSDWARRVLVVVDISRAVQGGVVGGWRSASLVVAQDFWPDLGVVLVLSQVAAGVYQVPDLAAAIKLFSCFIIVRLIQDRDERDRVGRLKDRSR